MLYIKDWRTCIVSNKHATHVCSKHDVLCVTAWNTAHVTDMQMYVLDMCKMQRTWIIYTRHAAHVKRHVSYVTAWNTAHVYRHGKCIY